MSMSCPGSSFGLRIDLVIVVVGWFGMALTEMVNLNVLRRGCLKVLVGLERKNLAKKA